MTHELSHNPIKIRYIDIKSGTLKKSYIFIGEVPINVKKELLKLEKIYNDKKNIINNSILKKFYGPNWKNKLGLYKKEKKGGNENYFIKPTVISGEDYDKDDLYNFILGGVEDIKNSNELDELGNELGDLDSNELDSNELGDLDSNELDSNELDSNNLDSNELDSNELDSNELDSNELDSNDLGDLGDLGIDLGAEKIDISDLDLENNIEEKTNIKYDVSDDIYSNEKIGSIEFIFDLQLYPMDNIMELKYKIYYFIGIPIYRQHLWFKYKNKSFPAHYNVKIDGNNVNINIENLISHYSGDNIMEIIEDIPVENKYYKNKDVLNVSANDTFNLIRTNYENYGINEYNLVDCNDLIDTNSIYKLRNDKYQLDIIYYGFITLYFPMITHQVFLDYIKNESNISSLYPELNPNINSLKKRYELESNILNESYDAIDDSNITKKIFSSVVETTISITNSKQDISSLLIIRNIFDTLVLNEYIVYCKANILYNNDIIYLKKSYLNEPEPKDSISVNSILIKIKINIDTNENIKLILYKNGNYIVKTQWREENHMDFEKITKLVSVKINPIIKQINDMGSIIKNYNIEIPILSGKNIRFTETSFVIYYEDDITENKFSIIKNILEDFRRAGILSPKENITMGYEYFLNKGMYKYESSNIEKLISLDNYYEYLSNGVISKKWNTIFERTRLVSIINISSRLKINISGVRNDIEIEHFNIFLMGLLSIFEKNIKKNKSIREEIIKTKSKKTLKNLKLQDPLLYDFKKIYNSKVIYSKICQKPHQPLLLNESEYQRLPKNKRENVVKYWNFTKEKPAWYSCPNAKYPYVKFMVKEHPKDYCIPCCFKMPMGENINIKKQEIHKTCMKEHKYSGKKLNLTKGSNYIAIYGKDVDVGRLSRLPEYTLEPLFFDTYSPEGIIESECITSEGYYLFGVEQNLYNINDVGYLYCIVHALNKSIDDWIIEAVKWLKNNSDIFRILMDGTASMYFNNIKEVIDLLLIINKENIIIHNKYDNLPWNILFMSISYYIFGVNYIIFDDKNKGSIDLILPKDLKSPSEMFPSNHKNLIVIKKNNKYYPVYLINIEVFKRTGIIESRLFLNESGLMITIQSIVTNYFENTDYEKIKKYIDLNILKKFIILQPNATIINYFINYSNLCYGVLIKYNKNLMFFPIHTSYYSLDEKIDLIFEAYDTKYDTNIDILLDFYNKFNNWVINESKKNGFTNIYIYPIIEVNKWLYVKKTNEVIGFVCNYINYYCKPISKKYSIKNTRCTF